MHSGRVACCPLVSHGEYADGTDGLTTSDSYVTLLDAASVMKTIICTALMFQIETAVTVEAQLQLQLFSKVASTAFSFLFLISSQSLLEFYSFIVV